MYSKGFFEKILSDLREIQANRQRELAGCPKGRIIQEKRKEKEFIFQLTQKEDGKKKRKLVEKDGDILKGILRRIYLEEEIAALEHNIKIIEDLTEKYKSVNSSDILQRMPKRFQKFPPEYFFPQPIEEGWENEPYEQSDYMTERKIHMTSRGLSVRSKSELSISEEFYKFEIPFRYEQVLRIGEYQIAPDFMPRNKRTGQQFYWEHCGMPGNEEYMKHHKWKMNLYESVGIVPWKNLIVTYDGEDGTLNLAEIESVIRNKLL